MNSQLFQSLMGSNCIDRNSQSLGFGMAPNATGLMPSGAEEATRLEDREVESPRRGLLEHPSRPFASRRRAPQNEAGGCRPSRSMEIRDATPDDAIAGCEVLRAVANTDLSTADRKNDTTIHPRWLGNKTVENFSAWAKQPDNYSTRFHQGRRDFGHRFRLHTPGPLA